MSPRPPCKCRSRLSAPERPSWRTSYASHLTSRKNSWGCCALAAAQDGLARWRAFLTRWQTDFPDIGLTCKQVLPVVERAYLSLIKEMTDRLREEETGLEDEFALNEFLDRYGMRLNQLGRSWASRPAGRCGTGRVAGDRRAVSSILETTRPHGYPPRTSVASASCTAAATIARPWTRGRLTDRFAWTGPAARLIGGRLAIQLGAVRLGRRLHLLTFRQSPAYLEGVYYHARYRLEQFGPLSCWRFLQAHPDWSDAAPECADWLAVHALALARLKDLDRAEKYLVRAESMAPARAWVHVERSSVLELSDRSEEALASARRALEIHPYFVRPSRPSGRSCIGPVAMPRRSNFWARRC